MFAYVPQKGRYAYIGNWNDLVHTSCVHRVNKPSCIKNPGRSCDFDIHPMCVSHPLTLGAQLPSGLEALTLFWSLICMLYFVFSSSQGSDETTQIRRPRFQIVQNLVCGLQITTLSIDSID